MQTSDIWLAGLAKVQEWGLVHSPRGRSTHELLGHRWPAVDMTEPVILVNERKLGYKFMAAEAAWIIDGRNDLAFIKQYSPMMKDFSDDGRFLFGAYGPRIRSQLPHVVSALQRDVDTRQAVITIWRESPPASKDIPCTVSLQFMVRDGLLHCFANMRSSDVWLGVPYDWFSFSMVSRYVLLCLQQVDRRFRPVGLGQLYFYAASQHLYDDNFDAADKLTSGLWSTVDNQPEFRIEAGETPEEMLSDLYQAALEERGILGWRK